MAGICKMAVGHQAPNLATSLAISPIVSGGYLKYSRCWETATRHRVRSATAWWAWQSTPSKMPRSSVFFRRSVHGTICISCRIRMGQIGFGQSSVDFLRRHPPPGHRRATRGPAAARAEIACEDAFFANTDVPYEHDATDTLPDWNKS